MQRGELRQSLQKSWRDVIVVPPCTLYAGTPGFPKSARLTHAQRRSINTPQRTKSEHANGIFSSFVLSNE